jgi:hypothetical protein
MRSDRHPRLFIYYRAAICNTILVALLTGCKKGAEDPSFTLLSRKARLARGWTMQEGSASVTTSLPKNDTCYYYEFAGGNADLKIQSSASVTTSSFPYELTISFNKDHTFSYKEESGSLVIEGSGEWSFGAGKDGSKKKEFVHLVTTKMKEGWSISNSPFTRNSTTIDYQIVGLSADQLHLSSSAFVSQNQNGEFQSIENSFTFNSD